MRILSRKCLLCSALFYNYLSIAETITSNVGLATASRKDASTGPFRYFSKFLSNGPYLDGQLNADRMLRTDTELNLIIAANLFKVFSLRSEIADIDEQLKKLPPPEFDITNEKVEFIKRIGDLLEYLLAAQELNPQYLNRSAPTEVAGIWKEIQEKPSNITGDIFNLAETYVNELKPETKTNVESDINITSRAWSQYIIGLLNSYAALRSSEAYEMGQLKKIYPYINPLLKIGSTYLHYFKESKEKGGHTYEVMVNYMSGYIDAKIATTIEKESEDRLEASKKELSNNLKDETELKSSETKRTYDGPTLSTIIQDPKYTSDPQKYAAIVMHDLLKELAQFYKQSYDKLIADLNSDPSNVDNPGDHSSIEVYKATILQQKKIKLEKMLNIAEVHHLNMSDSFVDAFSDLFEAKAWFWRPRWSNILNEAKIKAFNSHKRIQNEAIGPK